MNQKADFLSRHKILHTKWMLHPKLVQEIFRIWERPLIDLFAADQNHHLPTFCAWHLSKEAYVHDAFSLSWVNLNAYAYPPICLIPQVLKQMECHQCQVILIAPLWPRQAWFMRLLDLLVDIPMILSTVDNLLQQGRGHNRIFHPNPQMVCLTTWRLSSHKGAQEIFLRELRSWWKHPSERVRGRIISQSTADTQIGAIKGVCIPVEHLSMKF